MEDHMETEDDWKLTMESDTESEPELEEVISMRKNPKKPLVFDSDDSDTEGIINETPDTGNVAIEREKTPENPENLDEVNLGNVGDEQIAEAMDNIQAKLRQLVDSEDSDSDENRSQVEGTDEEEGPHSPEATQENLASRKNEKQQRMSAKAAMDQMKSIKSETQRMARETVLSIPYHKPKQHTLKEFLGRKTMKKPSEVFHNSQPHSLKMNSEELAVYAKYLEERAKEAAEFFQGEDESEKSKDVTIENSSNVEKPPENEEIVENSLIDSDPKSLNNEASDPGNAENDSAPMDTENIERNEQNLLEKENLVEAPKLDDLQLEENSGPTTESNATTSTQKEDDTEDYFDKITNTQSPSLNIENLKRLLAEPLTDLTDSPSLKGDPNMLIDLETGELLPPKLSAADQLVQKFLKNSAKPKSNQSKQVSILSTDNGNIEISKISLPINDDVTNKQTELKPGQAYLQLKSRLKEIIKAKRKQEFLKKLEEHGLNEPKKCLEDDDDEIYDDEKDEDELSDEAESDEVLDEEDETDLLNEEEVGDGKQKTVFLDENEELCETENTALDEDEQGRDEAESDSGDTEADDEMDEDGDMLDAKEKKLKKRRIIQAPDSDDEDINETLDRIISIRSECKGDAMLFGTQLNEYLGDCLKPDDRSMLFDRLTQMTQNFNEDELLALCSGTFGNATQKDLNVKENGDELFTGGINKILSSDEEDVEAPARQTKKRKQKLQYSDDEEDEQLAIDANKEDTEIDAAENGSLAGDNDEVDGKKNLTDEERDEEDQEFNEEEDIPETYIDYDSEENEIEVQMTKKDRQEKANEFFENEAELSESEWGSADEDEKDLDKYDKEFGDEENFDKEKLQEELGKIHMRRVLDDDIRDIKKIQEMFFEDEETDGVGRQRQFKWKNIDNSFGLDYALADNEDKLPESDDENEESWRKMRHERDKLLSEATANSVNTPLNSTTENQNLSTGKKITIIKNSFKTSETKTPETQFLIRKEQRNSLLRGSFLVRDKATLSRLAILTKGSKDLEETVGTVPLVSAKARNFVFTTLSPANLEEKAQKRKSTEETKTEAQRSKKPKLQENRKSKKRLIDHLE